MANHEHMTLQEKIHILAEIESQVERSGLDEDGKAMLRDSLKNERLPKPKKQITVEDIMKAAEQFHKI